MQQTGVFSLKWQQVSLAPQDSSQYSSWYQKYHGLNGIDSSSNLQFLYSHFHAFGNRSKATNYNCYYRHLHVPQFFKLSSKIQVFVYLFTYLIFTVVRWNNRIQWMRFFSRLLIHSLVIWPEIGDVFVSRNPWEICCISLSWTDSVLCI